MTRKREALRASLRPSPRTVGRLSARGHIDRRTSVSEATAFNVTAVWT